MILSLRVSNANEMITSKTLQLNNFLLSKSRYCFPDVLQQCMTCYSTFSNKITLISLDLLFTEMHYSAWIRFTHCYSLVGFKFFKNRFSHSRTH